MKAKEKFPHLSELAAKNHYLLTWPYNHQQEEARILLSAWDTRQPIPEADWPKQKHQAVLGWMRLGLEPRVIEWDGENWIEERGLDRCSPTHICALPEGPQ